MTDPAVASTLTEATLSAVLAVLRRDGWKPDGWGCVPPWSIRRAVGHVINSTYPVGGRDAPSQAAVRAIAAAIGSPLGAIMCWEGKPGRTLADVEAVLEKVIAGVTG